MRTAPVERDPRKPCKRRARPVPGRAGPCRVSRSAGAQSKALAYPATRPLGGVRHYPAQHQQCGLPLPLERHPSGEEQGLLLATV